MTYELVLRVSDELLAKPLVFDAVTFAIPPMVGDGVSWHDDWSLLTVEYRYIDRDSVELGVGRIASREVPAFLAAGWKQR